MTKKSRGNLTFAAELIRRSSPKSWGSTLSDHFTWNHSFPAFHQYDGRETEGHLPLHFGT